MPIVSLASGSRADKSFQIGLGFVVVFAIVEVAIASFYYFGRMRPAPAAAAAKVLPAPLPSIAPSAPPVALAITSPAPALTPATSTLSVSERLLKEATAARESGDTGNAIARLQEASQRDPKNAEVLAEMAMIYESIQKFDKSAETWRRVEAIGPSAGPLYELADMKLKTGVPPASVPSTPTLAKLDVATTGGSVEGIPPGSTLGISEVTASETPDPDAETNLMLRIGVKKRPSAVVDHTRVKIQVFFYDTVGDNDIKLTDADVSYEWLTPDHDWVHSNVETLAVTYIRSKTKARSAEADLAAAAAAINPAKKGKQTKPSPPSDSGQRKYLGYIVRVYYNDQLQDKRAQPTKLLSLFPAPFTAPAQ